MAKAYPVSMVVLAAAACLDCRVRRANLELEDPVLREIQGRLDPTDSMACRERKVIGVNQV